MLYDIINQLIGEGFAMATNHTTQIEINRTRDIEIETIISRVHNALVEKGYNPISQLVGYIMSGDPTYITSHKNARSLIMKVERDELVEEMLVEYIKNSIKKTV